MPMTRQRGFTLIETLVVVALICVLAAIAMPMLLRAKQSGNEASAIAALRTIISAQYMFSSSCGGGFFAPDLTVLGRAPSGSNPFIGEDLGAAATVVKGSYNITMGSTGGASSNAPPSCNGQAAATDTAGYWATATPSLNAGDLAFGTNGAGAIYQALQQTALAMTDTAAPAGSTILDR